ncbi:MAG TPA: hypothetical protein P5134_02150 [Bacteroidales bacterium]|nr:hypothetical protein [Bacteroidales bacterium]HOS57718.1 hypothetical protein [Bacteroidales bacterium]HRR04068.1 hypothetical protein [Bacteroidales bacterium]HRT13396.1 hypothetical protein [Bacteroidales bacterium]
MYNFELKQLDATAAITETLNVIENFCETYKLENDFGTISLAMNDLLILIIENSDSKNLELAINFNLNNQQLAIQITSNQTLDNIMPALSNASPENNDQNIFVIKQLIDNISFDAENNQLLVEFDVKPQFIDIQQNRERVLAEQKKVTYK